MLLRYSSLSFILLGSLMHLFCCGIPTLLALTSLAAVLGISTGAVGEWEWYEAIESYVLVASGVLLLFSIIAYAMSRYVDCSAQESCTHLPCERRKDHYRSILIAVTVLYAFNLALYLLA
ncbi:MAG: hypothetical protein P8P30_03265 [Rickettsiales bacterium]|nr:hypothetical protein [Rickettsiales bacterium]